MPCLTVAPPIDVLLVDDQRAILAGVTALIESAAPSMRVAAQARCAGDALAAARDTSPDVIVLDVDLNGEDGLELIPLFRACCNAAIVVFTSVADSKVRSRAFGHGASGFVLKTAPGDELIAAIVDAGR